MSSRLLRFLTPAGLGAVAALGQAPFDFPAVMLVAMAAAFFLWAKISNSREGAAFGFAFGFGYFAVCLHWIVSPFLVDAARHGWMAPFAVVLMAAGGALFWTAAFWAARRLGRGIDWLIVTLPAIEFLRAYIFTGFPWGAPAQATVNSILGQGLSVFGPHGMNIVLVTLAVVIARSAQRWGYWSVLVAVGISSLLMVPVMRSDALLTGTVLRLVQPNAPQAEKWDPDKIGIFYARQLAFTAAEPDPALGAPDAVVWPETAIPWNLTHAQPILAEISAAAAGKPVLLGVQRTEGERYFNTLVLLGGGGQVTQLYDKHHLVPFGEYMPLGDFLARFGIYGLAPQHGAGFSSGPGAALMDLGPLGRFLPLICYEAVFAHDVNAAPARPDFIIHATNDAWFGTHAGPQQHLAQARMRAIEQGLPVARAANTGISAMIDPYGRLTNSLGLGQAGYIDAALPQARMPTFYSRTGDWAALVLLLAIAGVLRFRGRLRALAQ
ncbi:apolipoprotein N-acyltransferase [Sulfitobacter guttiformis]|uniref:Apolipoprotein N-acyltransferase n=1 Tax=Sulfitobacter guttiformis TaxID=74349 RepID=A0A420DPP8_9RHOB|nr:apolipoprotein N-acyltransferase [Sulfitobacter guttiformis]KIN73587.1 Apolipoprotein N-acyltransferase [Sulfitobacter guttiformis KCTC 32187]RKE96235.1 apolipoprotein N-acyltransferase [Sulfitobacter guttiformis]